MSICPRKIRSPFETVALPALAATPLLSQARIAYAPALLPDELLYSWLARLAGLNAMGTPRDGLEQIFGCRSIVPSVDLPTRLLALQERLCNWLPFPALDELLEDSTMLPYHRPFLTPERHARVHHLLLHGDGKGLKTLMGRVANRFGAHPPLRHCPDCLADSLDRHGCFYWMRRHQLPGVNCCSIHGIALQRVPLQARTHRQQWILPAAPKVAPQRAPADATQLRFARLSEECITAAMPAFDPDLRSRVYQTAIRSLGYGHRRGRVDFPALAGALRERFDDFEGFEHRERLLASTVHPLGWLRPLFDRPQRSIHPICHLLLIEFLFGSIAGFQAACSAQVGAVEGSGPAHASHKRFVASAADSEASCKSLAAHHEAALRDPLLSCRQVAARIGRSVTTVVACRRALAIPIRERRKSLHAAVIDQVVRLLRSETSLPVVAARTGVSLSSVYRILAQHPAVSRYRQEQARNAELPLRRGRWTAALQACQDEGPGGKTAARTRAAADYAWLYRHDRAWLASTTQSAPRQNRSGQRVDWVRRDAELCQALQQQLGLLREEVPPQRMTKTRLLRPLGEAMVQRHLPQLPRLDALLARSVESPTAFGRRRVDHAILTLSREGQALQLWRIRRQAGLRQWSDALIAHANSQIERLHAQNPIRPDSLP